MKYKRNLILFLFLCIILSGCSSKRPSKNDAIKYLNQYLDESYEITNETHEEGIEGADNYKLYLPDSNINVNFSITKEYTDAVHMNWCYRISDYYEAKYLSLSDERKLLRETKYPMITEEIKFYNENDINIDFVNITISSRNDLENLYKYLSDCYKLNDFKYYCSYSKKNNNFIALYWQDCIGLRIFCDNKLIGFFYFDDLRKEECCMPDELNDMITYEEFLELLNF